MHIIHTKQNKTRFKWNAKLQQWYFVSSWVRWDNGRIDLAAFNVELNRLNKH